jgi:hypothetical protein
MLRTGTPVAKADTNMVPVVLVPGRRQPIRRRTHSRARRRPSWLGRSRTALQNIPVEQQAPRG